MKIQQIFTFVSTYRIVAAEFSRGTGRSVMAEQCVAVYCTQCSISRQTGL